MKTSTRAALKGMKRGGESYDQIINRFMKAEDETIMKWTHRDLEYKMKTLYGLDPAQEDLEAVADLVNWEQNIEDGHDRIRRAIEEYLIDVDIYKLDRGIKEPGKP